MFRMIANRMGEKCKSSLRKISLLTPSIEGDPGWYDSWLCLSASSCLHSFLLCCVRRVYLRMWHRYLCDCSSSVPLETAQLFSLAKRGHLAADILCKSCAPPYTTRSSCHDTHFGSHVTHCLSRESCVLTNPHRVW